MSDWTLHPNAHALSAFRVLRNGSSRQYSATTFPNGPWQGCWATVNRLDALFGFAQPDDDYYAVLDVLDAEGDIIQDFLIPSAKAFKYLKGQLGWVVERDDSKDRSLAEIREARSALREDRP